MNYFKYLRVIKIIFVLITLLVTNSSANICPNKCRCFKLDQNNFNSDIIRLDCSATKLSHIPLNIPSTVQVLDLSQNFIKKIEVKKLEHLKKLHTILLSRNRIKHLDKVCNYFLINKKFY